MVRLGVKVILERRPNSVLGSCSWQALTSLTPLDALKALVVGGKFPAEFEPDEETPRWGQLYSYVFSEHLKHPNEQRELISTVVGDREYALNWTHACIGALVEKRFVHTILTT